MLRRTRLLRVALLGVSAIALSSGATFARFSDQQIVSAQVGAGSWAPQTPEACAGMTFTNIIEGTAGDDSLSGTQHPDLIFGYGGNDTILAGNQDDCLVGGPGDDTLKGENGRDVFIGGDGNDTCHPGNGPDGAADCEVINEAH